MPSLASEGCFDTSFLAARGGHFELFLYPQVRNRACSGARARLACRRAGIRVAGAFALRYFELRDMYSLAREVVAYPAYALRIRGGS